MNNDKIEFYCDGVPLPAVYSSMTLSEDQYINIEGVTYQIMQIHYALDRSRNPIRERVLRCIVSLNRVSG